MNNYTHNILVLFIVVLNSVSTGERRNAQTLVSGLYRWKVLYSPIYRFKILNENIMPDEWKSEPKDTQDFYALRNECLRNRHLGLFEDPDFDTVDASLFYNKSHFDEYRNIVYGYDHRYMKFLLFNITEDPKVIDQKATRFDIKQGSQGDCWFLSVVAELPSLDDELFSHIVPSNQYFDNKNYCGIFHFRFWQAGYWVDVVVDDRLPTIFDEKTKQINLLFAGSSQNEYWGALLEKAYAKLYGSYQALDGGEETEAMQDFTGCMAMTFHLDELVPIPNLFLIIKKCITVDALITASILKGSPDEERNLERKNLISQHAYSITDAKYVHILHSTSNETERVALFRIRNPWGSTEWNGPWSDQAQEWNFVETQDRENLHVIEDDGEYWMRYDDFINMFNSLSLCLINPHILSEDAFSWGTSIFRGEWTRGKTLGGCSAVTLHKNPQFQVILGESDDDSDSTIFITLMQENQRVLRNFIKEDEQYLPASFLLYEVKNSSEYINKLFDSKYIRWNHWIRSTLSYKDSRREVSHVFEIPPGIYRIITCTRHSGVEGQFTLRIVSDKKIKEMDLL